jgi:assimilatory nitrate reductase catalytic subunit
MHRVCRQRREVTVTSERTTRTACPYCGVGCGVLATPRADGGVAIAGDPDHPANFGRLCSKGAALGETLSLDDRLLYPAIDGVRAGWNEALDLVAKRFATTIGAHGPGSVALYVSGQILTEDYYVANKLMKGFIGTANIDTNSRLCMASSVAGHKRAFGADTVPGTYEDLERADLVVLVGSNLAWCHPVLYQRLAAARQARGTRVVVIDPRRTATCDIADLHLAIAPGADVALFNGLLAHLGDEGHLAEAYLSAHTSGLEATLATARALTREDIARITDLSPADLARFYDLFASTPRVVTVYSQGVNQSSAGTDKVNAILNCHLATGRIGKPGMGPFSVTGQPNAMGGREVGGLANMLAAHMDLADPAHRRIVQGFWDSPRIASAPGLKAVDMFEAVADGRIKALWIMATNPVDSLPVADQVREAIRRCPFVVVSDVTRRTDTTALAHVLLPAAAWGEKDGTVTNSERRISRQRAFLPLPGEARPDWWQLAEVAKRLGFSRAFGWVRPADIFAEYAALTGTANDGTRDLDLSAFSTLSPQDYEALPPVQWPKRRGDDMDAETRFFAEGGFYTPDRRARLVPTPYRPPAAVVSARFPLRLNTGRIRDQWHTMTRTAKAPRLMTHRPEPFLEIAPADAAHLGILDGALVEVESAHGGIICRARIEAGQRSGEVFAPIHWTDQFASRARVDTLIAAVVDPISGQPESKLTAVAVRPAAMAWHGFAVLAEQPVLPPFAYAALAPCHSGWSLELADRTLPAQFDTLAHTLLAVDGRGADLLAYQDRGSGQHRFAVFAEDRFVAALYVARTSPTVARGWVSEQLGHMVSAQDRLRLLAGRPGGAVQDKGPIVCACFEVGRTQITDAIVRSGCRSVAEVGAQVKAGTNCGSCRAEIGRLVDETRLAQAG